MIPLIYMKQPKFARKQKFEKTRVIYAENFEI